MNDNLGHEHGDELLVTVSDAIRSNIRDNDFIIPQGGDEFIIVFNGVGIKDSEKIWERTVTNFKKINKNNNSPYIISLSHGIIEYKNDPKIGIDELIQLADDKMYREKEIMKKDFNVLKKSIEA